MSQLRFIFVSYIYIYICTHMHIHIEEEIRLYFNNQLHIHQHTFFKYMIQSVIDGKNKKTNMSVYDITLHILACTYIDAHKYLFI